MVGLGAKLHHSGWEDLHATKWGAKPFHQMIGVAADKVSVSSMMPSHRIPELFDWFDVGIVPLNQIDFNVAKSFIKGLEYAASGTPFVAQASAEYLLLEADGVGVTVSNERQWFGALKRLWSSRDARVEQMESNAAGLAKHSMELRAGEWEEIIRSCV
jgi:hypothetical protein